MKLERASEVSSTPSERALINASKTPSLGGRPLCLCKLTARQLFRYDELELLICGSKELDFQALESAATYQAQLFKKCFLKAV